MDFEYSDKVTDLIQQVRGFMEEHILPNENTHIEQLQTEPWTTPTIVEERPIL